MLKKRGSRVSMQNEPQGKACDQTSLESWSVHTVDRFGSPGLHWAASGGHLDICKALVEIGGANPKQRDKKSGRCALHWAARQGHLDVAHWLVCSCGLSPDEITKDGTSAFHLAIWGGHVNVAEWLVDGPFNQSDLESSAIDEGISIKGADLHRLNNWDCNAAHFAGLAGMRATAEWLWKRGVDLRNTNKQGHNALHKAAYGGHKELCAWLQGDLVCSSPLPIPFVQTKEPISSLPQLDPRAELPDARGQTPVDLAVKAGHHELAVWLMRHRHRHEEGTQLLTDSISQKSEGESERKSESLTTN